MEDEKFNEEIFNMDIQFEKYNDKVWNNPDLQREILELKSISFSEKVLDHVQADLN